MPLFRILYLRGGKAHAVTVGRPDAQQAESFAQTFCMGWSDGGEWLTIKAIQPVRRVGGSAKDFAVRLVESGELEIAPAL